MKYIKKYWYIVLIILITTIRYVLGYRLPSFYLLNLRFDDSMIFAKLKSLNNAYFFGVYNDLTLIKGNLFPLLLYLIFILKISYSSFFTILYILSCLYLVNSLSLIIKDKKVLLIIYILLLFNPISYSSDLFQRLYRNTLSLTEILFFLGIIIRLVKKDKIVNYILLGIVITCMFLTREDNIYVYVILVMLFIYKIIKNKSLKKSLYIVIPIIILVVNLNVVSFINYKYYGIYTYNEIDKSEFNKTFMKIISIKDDEKIDKVSIPKSTLYKISENCKSFGISKKELKYHIDKDNEDKEIDNGYIIWFLRRIIYDKFKFKSGYESEEYYRKLGNELDELFEKKVFEKEIYIPNIYMNMPTKNEFKSYPKNILETVKYTYLYTNVKTIDDFEGKQINNVYNVYPIKYEDYHHTEDIPEKNPIYIEIIRIVYVIINILFTPFAIYLYIKNIKKIDELNIIIHIVFVIYLLIILGVAYTHTTAFYAIRYFYLGNVYVLQSLFILLNLARVIGSEED